MILNSPLVHAGLQKLIWRLDLESLRLFARVCQEGSISKVAMTEGTSASRISKRLTAIVNLLGTEILKRTPTGYVPTECGINLLICWESISVAAATSLADDSAQSALRLVVPQLRRRDLDRDFGLSSICNDAFEPRVVEIMEARFPWGWAEGLSNDVAIWAESSAPSSAADEAISMGLTEQLRFQVLRCVAVCHVCHELAEAEEIDEFSLLNEHTISIAGAGFVPAQARAHVSLGAEKWCEGISSALHFLASNPSNLILCLPASARWLLSVHPQLKRLSLSHHLTHEYWMMAYRPQQAAEALAKCSLSILSSQE